MRKLFIILTALFCLNLVAKDYSPAEIDAILQENIKTKALLKEAGLALDLKSGRIKLIDSNSFMSACNAIVFSEAEFESLNENAKKSNALKQGEERENIKDSAKKDFNDRSKSFWNSVIY